MKKIGLYVVIGMILISMLIVFRPSTEVRESFLLAEELMCSAPDSSLRILEGMDGKYFSGENNALHALLLTQAKFKNYEHVTSDSLINIAVAYYKEGKDSLRKAQSYFYKGRVEENIENIEEALSYYQQALSAASSTNDYNLLGLISYYWGLLLQEQFLFDDALPVQKKSLEYAKLDNDTTRQMFVLKEIGNNYTLKKQFDKALSCYNQALRLAELRSKKEYMSIVYNHLGVLYKYRQEYDSAISCVNKSISLGSDSSLVFSGFLLKGDLFTLQQKYDSARYYLNKGRRNNEITSKATYCFFMNKLEEGVGNYQNALAYSNEYITYADTIEEEHRKSEIAKYQKKYDYSLVKNKNTELELEKKNRDVIILITVLVLIVAIWIYSYLYKKIRREKNALHKASQEQLEEMTNKLVKRKIELDEVQQKSKADLEEIREKVLTSNEFIKKINLLNEMSTGEKIANAQKMRLTDKDIKDLREVVNICFDDFEIRLSEYFPKWKDESIRFCCLLKMRVPISTIAILVDVDEASLTKRKYRLKKSQAELLKNYSSLDEFILKF